VITRASSSPDILLSPPDVGDDERRALLNAFDSNWIAPTGAEVDGFENEMAARLGVGHAVAVSSGTAAMHLALMALGVGPGDTVIVATLTFVATANAVAYCGATPVFVDCHPDNWTLDPGLVHDALHRFRHQGRRVAAVVAVDLYGQCANYEALSRICREHGVALVEDATESLGASYCGRPAGSFGDVAVLSFNGDKVITTSAGGMLLSNHGPLAESARYLATEAREPVAYNEHLTVGFNYRLSSLLAAVGRAQLRRLDEYVEARRANNAWYRRELCGVPGLTFMPLGIGGRSSCWLTVVLINEQFFGASRDAVIRHLARRGIESRPTWKPMHLQPVWHGCEVLGGVVSADIFRRGLCLPSGSALDDEQRARVVAGVVGARRRHLVSTL